VFYFSCKHFFTHIDAVGSLGGLRTNGHSASAAATMASTSAERYGTRCATGVIKRKRYDRVLFTDDENDRDEDNPKDADYGARTDSRRRRPRQSDSEDSDRDQTRRRTGKSSARRKTNSLATKSKFKSRDVSTSGDDDSKEKLSDDSEKPGKSGKKSAAGGDKSGSDTEEYSSKSDSEESAANSDVENIPLRQTRSSRARIDDVSRIDHSYGAKYETRNQGRRTVRYDEDSDRGGDTDIEITRMPSTSRVPPSPSTTRSPRSTHQTSIRNFMRS